MTVQFDDMDLAYIARTVKEFDGGPEDVAAATEYIKTALCQEQVIYDEIKSYFENKEDE